MAKKAQGGDINRSALIRDFFAQDPEMKVKDIVGALKKQGIIVAPNLVYLVKGKLKGEGASEPRAENASPRAAGGSDALMTIHKVKKLALDVGGLRMLKGIVDAL